MRNLVAIEEELVAGFAQTESNPWKMLRTRADRNEAQVKKEKGTGRLRSERSSMEGELLGSQK